MILMRNPRHYHFTDPKMVPVDRATAADPRLMMPVYLAPHSNVVHIREGCGTDLWRNGSAQPLATVIMELETVTRRFCDHCAPDAYDVILVAGFNVRPCQDNEHHFVHPNPGFHPAMCLGVRS